MGASHSTSSEKIELWDRSMLCSLVTRKEERRVLRELGNCLLNLAI